jgi:hypothetical protein
MNTHTDELDELFTIRLAPSGDLLERRLCEMSDDEAHLADGWLEAEHRALSRVIDAITASGDVREILTQAKQILQKQQRLLASRRASLAVLRLRFPEDGLPF